MFDALSRSKRHSRNNNRRKSAARNRRVGSRNAQLEPLESRHLLSTVPVMVADINPSEGSSSPDNFAELDGVSYFFADEGIHGNELWTSDGTAEGTHLVKDISPGEASSYYPRIVGFDTTESVDGMLVITLSDQQLWASDGTTAGTVLLKDDYTNFRPHELTVLNDRVFFANRTPNATLGKELWSTDGTLAGTELFADIQTGVGGSDPMYLQVVDGHLFFDATGDDGERHLWVTNGIDAPVRFADSALGSDFDRVCAPPSI